jgi:hypothetical protein
MEWKPWSWDEAFGEPVGRVPADGREDRPRVSPSAGADSSDLDTQLIALVYSAIAAGSSCETCGSRLARKLRVFPLPAGAHGARRLAVVAKCRGWKRHVHVARVVINEGDDTPLRPLRAIDCGVSQ